MRILRTAAIAASASLLSFAAVPGSSAQTAHQGMAANTIPVPNAPIENTYPQTRSYVPDPGTAGSVPAQNVPVQDVPAQVPAVGGYDPAARGAPSQPAGQVPATQQQAYQSGQTYVPARGYASEKLDGASDGFSPEEIKSAGHQFFGNVSSGFASAVEYVFQRSGRPNGYITGEEAGGAFVAGVRYGEGTLHTSSGHTYRVFWQGPSVGYDFGAEGSKTMVLVYNLHNPDQIYNKFAGVEGSAYLVGGVGVTYLTRDDLVLAPIRSGVGLRLGANVGYLKYTRQPTWNPF